MRALNLGCGQRFHPDWENLDIYSSAPGVRACDLRKGIPYPNGYFDVVYHSHLLEHFPKQFAPVFLCECHRVVRSRGVIRVAVPDLETIARLYLQALEGAYKDSAESHDNYEWMMLEMYDQTVREKTCGECAEYLRQDPIPNWDFVFARWGMEAKSLLESVRAQEIPSTNGRSRSRVAWRYVLHNPGKVLRSKLIKTILGTEDRDALRLGRFRRGGEIHMWMYDAYSLGRLLGQAGFTDITRQTATESRIPNWKDYHLDSELTGSAYKPDSLYMEAIRP